MVPESWCNTSKINQVYRYPVDNCGVLSSLIIGILVIYNCVFTNHNIDTREKALLGLLECGHNRYFTVYIPMGDTVSFSYSWCTY